MMLRAHHVYNSVSCISILAICLSWAQSSHKWYFYGYKIKLHPSRHSLSSGKSSKNWLWTDCELPALRNVVAVKPMVAQTFFLKPQMYSGEARPTPNLQYIVWESWIPVLNIVAVHERNRLNKSSLNFCTFCPFTVIYRNYSVSWGVYW